MALKHYIYFGSLVALFAGFMTIAVNHEKYTDYNNSDHYHETKLKLVGWDVISECTSMECVYLGTLKLQFQLYHKEFDCKPITAPEFTAKNRTDVEDYMRKQYIVGGEFIGFFDWNSLEDPVPLCYLYNPRPSFPLAITVSGVVLMVVPAIVIFLTACCAQLHKQKAATDEATS
jgi:hypothetical protein